MALPTRASETAHLQVMNRISPPISRLDHLAELSQKQLNARPSAPFVGACNSFKNLTVYDLKRDPHLRNALRSLRATMQSAPSPPQRPATVDLGALRGGGSRQPPREVLTRSHLAGIKHQLKRRYVARDEDLTEALKALQHRVEHLSLHRRAASFSAVGEKGGQELLAIRGGPAGKQYIASIGPGWVGPHRVMESFRRPTGPAFC